MRWLFFLVFLTLGGVSFWCLTEIPTASGDPVICIDCWKGGHHHHASESMRPSSYLKTLWFSQSDFRANDRDLDGKAQFWRADVAGLYALAPGGGPAIRLIDAPLALADDRPTYDFSPQATRGPWRGHWYRAIRHADEDPKALDPNRFAFCAYPDSPDSGKYIWVVDQDQRIFRSLANGRRGIEVFPTDEELKKEWNRTD